MNFFRIQFILGLLTTIASSTSEREREREKNSIREGQKVLMFFTSKINNLCVGLHWSHEMTELTGLV